MTSPLHFGATQIEFLCRDLQDKIINSQVVNCLAIDANRFTLIFEKHHNKYALFFCFESLFTRFHLVPQYSVLSFSVHASLGSYLLDAQLKSIAVINEDRIVCFEFQHATQTIYLICEFFSKYPNYYITTDHDHILFSRHPIRASHYSFPTKHTQKSRIDSVTLSHDQLRDLYPKKEQELKSSQAKEELNTYFLKKLKKLKQIKQALEKQLDECQNWQTVYHLADLIKAHLGRYKKGAQHLLIWDWLTEKEVLIHLNSKLSINEEMAFYYKKSKKLQKGIEPVQAQLTAINNKITNLAFKINELNHSSEEDIQQLKELYLSPPTKEEHENKQIKKALPYHEYFSKTGIAIWVGKNARSNEIPTFKLANGNDWWLHVNGKAGSHVVIKLKGLKVPDPETLQDAIQLALFHSKAKESAEGEICITQKKFVNRLGRDKVGKVQVSQHTTSYARLGMEKYKQIRARR